MKRQIGRWIATALPSVQAGLLAYSGWVHSPVFDETAALPAGLAMWEFGRFDQYQHNPPLVKLVASLPVLAAGYESDWRGVDASPLLRPEFTVGSNFVTNNGPRSFWLFTLARWACIPFAVLGGWVVWRWSSLLFGEIGGLVSLTLWTFSPEVLGHGATITPDVAAASLGVAACYAYWRWLERPTWVAALVAGAVLGLAELAKFTLLVLYALWPLIWWRMRRRGPAMPDGAASSARELPGWQLAGMLSLSVLVIDLGYGFSGVGRPLGEHAFSSAALNGRGAPSKTADEYGNRFAGTPLGWLPTPLPAEFLAGFDLQKREFENGYPSYLAGEWRHGGWWHYYVYALAIKTPLGTLLLLTLALALGWRDGLFPLAESSEDTRSHSAAAWCLVGPPVAILLLVSSQTGFNHHLRYVLPALPFAFVLAGRLGPAMAEATALSHRARWTVRAAAVIGLGATVLASVAQFPHSAAYFNLLAGGPTNGPRHLLDSSVGWGQDLLYLKRWFDAHPEALPLGLAYYGNMDPRIAGIEFTVPPRGPSYPLPQPPANAAQLGPLPGWYAMDVNHVFGNTRVMADGRGGRAPPRIGDDDYRYFQRFEPVARVGHSVWIYHVTPSQAEAARRELGLRAAD